MGGYLLVKRYSFRRLREDTDLIMEVHPGSRRPISVTSIPSTDPSGLPHLPLTAVFLIITFSLLRQQHFLPAFFEGQLLSLL